MTSENHSTSCRTAPGDVEEQEQTQIELFTTVCSLFYSVALGHLEERDRGGLLLEQVRVCVCPAQGQNESPLLTVEAKLKLLLFRARRRSCMVSARKVKEKRKEAYDIFYFTTAEPKNNKLMGDIIIN